MSDQPVAETYTWHHTTVTTERHLCSRRKSNPQSQQASGHRPTPQAARPLGSALCIQNCLYKHSKIFRLQVTHPRCALINRCIYSVFCHTKHSFTSKVTSFCLCVGHLRLFCLVPVYRFDDVPSFIHTVFCLTTGPKPPPKRCLHIVRCRASSFK